MKYKTIIGRVVELTEERKRHIYQQHPDVITHFGKISKILLTPDQIRIDNQDPKALLFYKHFSKIDKGKYLVVVVKTNERNFILTFFSTYRMKTGEKYEF